MSDGISTFRRAAHALGRWPARREVIVRSDGRVFYIPLSNLAQVVLFALVVGLAGWIGHTSFNYFDLQQVVVNKNAEIARAEQKSRDLVDNMSRMRNQFSDVAGTLERNHRDLVNLLKQNNVLKREDRALSNRLMRTSYTPRWSRMYSASKGDYIFFPKEIRIFDQVEKGNKSTIVIRKVDLKTLKANIFTKAWLESKSR